MDVAVKQKKYLRRKRKVQAVAVLRWWLHICVVAIAFFIGVARGEVTKSIVASTVGVNLKANIIALWFLHE